MSEKVGQPAENKLSPGDRQTVLRFLVLLGLNLFGIPLANYWAMTPQGFGLALSAVLTLCLLIMMLAIVLGLISLYSILMNRERQRALRTLVFLSVYLGTFVLGQGWLFRDRLQPEVLTFRIFFSSRFEQLIRAATNPFLRIYRINEKGQHVTSNRRQFGILKRVHHLLFFVIELSFKTKQGFKHTVGVTRR